MKVSAEVRVQMREERLRKAMERARDGNLRAAAYLISQLAKKRIVKSRVASRPGKPPHSRRGAMRNAIRYEVAEDKYSAVIGPIPSIVGTSGQAHEFGGRYMGNTYPERPFMGPAMEEAIPQIGPKFRGTVGE